jgi:hypothetical protein
MDQIDQFQRMGQVVSTCNGACNFDGGPGDSGAGDGGDGGDGG